MERHLAEYAEFAGILLRQPEELDQQRRRLHALLRRAREVGLTNTEIAAALTAGELGLVTFRQRVRFTGRRPADKYARASNIGTLFPGRELDMSKWTPQLVTARMREAEAEVLPPLRLLTPNEPPEH
jgi:hypothetical protein